MYITQNLPIQESILKFDLNRGKYLSYREYMVRQFLKYFWSHCVVDKSDSTKYDLIIITIIIVVVENFHGLHPQKCYEVVSNFYFEWRT